jgi:hypothetical protein
MIVPIAHQIANGGGHKGSRSLWTSGEGLWQQADTFGDQGTTPAEALAFPIVAEKLGAIRAQNHG